MKRLLLILLIFLTPGMALADGPWGRSAAQLPYSDGGTASPRIDASTHALEVIDYSHHEIHSGSHFQVKDWIDLTNGQVYDFLLVTPNTTEWAHIGFMADAEAEFDITIYAGATASSNGTSLTVTNRNGNSAHANTTLIYHTPTMTTLGTKIARYKGGSGKSTGGTAGTAREVILPQNSKILVRVTNNTVSNNWFNYLIDWYEHTDKD